MRVLPEQKLPLEEVKQTENAVRAALARCALSVHLVGTRYGSTPEDDARSVVRIQEQLAAEHGAANPAFLRVLWMPQGLMTPALEIKDERQKSFVSELQNRITAGAELLQTTVEDLKTRIVEKLNPPAKASCSARALVQSSSRSTSSVKTTIAALCGRSRNISSNKTWKSSPGLTAAARRR